MAALWIAIWSIGFLAGVLGGVALGRAHVLNRRVTALELDIDRLGGGQRYLMKKAGIDPASGSWLPLPRVRRERN